MAFSPIFIKIYLRWEIWDNPCFAKRLRRTRWEWCVWRGQAIKHLTTDISSPDSEKRCFSPRPRDAATLWTLQFNG